MHHDQQEEVPQLLPISIGSKRQDGKPYLKEQEKKNSSINDSVNKQFTRNNNANNISLSKQNDKKGQEKIKVIDYERRFENNENKITKKDDDSEKSKILIAAMLKKISTNSLSQQKYPVSNEVIDALINGLQAQIMELRMQSDKKIITNMNDMHTRKQKAQIQKSIQRCVTIKQLYLQKIHLFNQIKHLQIKNIQLKNQNRDLKIKVSRGIQTIENHMHNLPCEREKQLKEQLNKCLHQLDQEKFMRQNLQQKAADIVMNFNRLYEQADTARLIVVKKLSQIEQKEKALDQKSKRSFDPSKSELDCDSFQQESMSSQEKPKQDKKPFNASFPLDLESIIKINKQRSVMPKPPKNQQDEQWRMNGKQGGISNKIYENHYKGTSKTPVKNKPRESKSPNIASKMDERLKKTREDQSGISKTAKRF